MSIEEEFIKVLGDDDYINWGTLCGQKTYKITTVNQKNENPTKKEDDVNSMVL